MRFGWKSYSAILVFATLAAGVSFLASPGTPSASRSLKFAGYVPLGRSRIVSLLDYLTISGDQLFVANFSSGSIVRVGIGAPSLSRQISSLKGRPVAHGIAIDPVSHLGFVSRSDVNEVEVFDPRTMVSIKHINVQPDPDAILYVPGADSAPAVIYVAHGDSKIATLIAPSSQTISGTVVLGGQAEFAVFDQTSRLVYQNLEDTGEVVAIDPKLVKIAGRWPVAGCEGPTGLAIDEPGQRLIVACGNNSRVAIFDLATHQTTATYPVGRHPDTVAYDSQLRRIYAAGGFGQLSVLQGSDSGGFNILDTVETHIGAHTLAFDPSTHRLYVGYAGLLVGPRLAVFDAVP